MVVCQNKKPEPDTCVCVVCCACLILIVRLIESLFRYWDLTRYHCALKTHVRTFMKNVNKLNVYSSVSLKRTYMLLVVSLLYTKSTVNCCKLICPSTLKSGYAKNH